MRICYIANTAYNVHFKRWYQYFLDQGHEVTVISGDPSRGDNDISLGQIPVHFLPEKKLNNRVLSTAFNLIRLPIIVARLRKLLAEIKPDLIHAHGSFPEGLWGALSGFHPLIVTPIGSDLLVYPKKSWFLRKISKYVVNSAEHLTCDSFPLFNEIVGYGKDPLQVHIIHNGIDLHQIPSTVSTSDVRNRLGVGDAPLILSVRAITKIYNIPAVIKSMPKILEKHPDAKLILCYYSHTNHSSLPLKNLVNDLGLGKNVIFRGFVQKQELYQLMQESSVMLSVPFSDSSPSSVYEAMACGLPVVLSRLPWTDLVFRDQENALLVNPESTSEISQATLKIMDDKILAGKLAENGKKVVRENFDYVKNMEKVNAVMKKVVCP